LPSHDACIICAINSNSDNLQHYRVAEQNGLKAVLDIFPIAEGHVLILSRSHVSHLEQLSAEEHAELFQFTPSNKADSACYAFCHS